MTWKRQYIVSGLVLVIAIAVGATWAWAQVDEAEVVYYACVNKSSGTIKMVEAGEQCKNNEDPIFWNQVGQPGGGCTIVDSGEGATIQCEDGTEATVFDGAPGADGQPGADGTSCSVNRSNELGLSYIVCEDGTTASVYDGADGEPGPPGPEGPPGEPGAPGLINFYVRELSGPMPESTKDCESGDLATGGGYSFSPLSPDTVAVINRPVGDPPTGWLVVVEPEPVANLTVYVICADLTP